MKVVYVSENFPPYTFGGGELSGYTLAKYLASDPDFEVHVVTKIINGKESDEKVDNFQIHRVIPEGSSKLPDDIRRGEILTHNTAKYLKPYLKDADIVHTISMRVSIGAFKAARKRALPILGTVNDSWATCYYSLHFQNKEFCWNCSMGKLKDCLDEFGGNKLALPYLVRTMKSRAEALKKFDCLLPRSKLIEEVLRKNGFTNRMQLFPPIIDLDEYQYKEPEYTKQILFVGRLDRGKGVEDAILAMKHTKEGQLVVIGNGPYQADFEKLAAKNNLDARVIFKGRFPEDKVIQEIYASDIILAPFRRIEPMPRIIPESFACGRGIITTDCCGGSEIIKNGENGYVLKAGEYKKIGKLIDSILLDKTLIKKLGVFGRKSFEKHLHPDKILKKYKNLLLELGR
jgi:glycosyltransferase involved in cell wall biosynthesis